MALRRCERIFGRDRELALLRSALTAAAAGRGGFVMVTGAPGIGKTRLAAQLCDTARERGMAVVLGRATAREASVSFRPFTQALLELVRERGMPDDEEFAPWRPVLAPMLGSPDAAGGQSVALRGEAVMQLLARRAGEGALVVIEDLHWADADTVELLDHFADGAGSASVLWLVTGRETGTTTELIRRLAGRSAVVVVPLAPLSGQAVAQMVAECRPGADAALLSRVQRAGEGVPLFVEEIAAADGVPESFVRAVDKQLASLDSVARQALETAAVLDDPGSPLLARLGIAAAAFTPALDRGLLVRGQGVLRFRHVLTRDAIVELMGSRRREVAAAALIAAGADDGPAIVELAIQAGDIRRAGLLLGAMGVQARRDGVLSTAVETLERAVRLLSGEPEQRAVRLDLIEALSLAGRVQDAFDAGQDVLASDPSECGWLILAETAARGGRWAQAAAYLRGAQPGDRKSMLAAEIAFATGANDSARAAAAQVGEADPELAVRAAILLGRIARLEDLGAAREAFTRALTGARSARLPVGELDALHELGTIDMLEHAGAERLLDARRVAEQIGALGTRAVLDLQLTATYLSRFETQTAADHAAAAADIGERLGLPAVSAKAHLGLAETRAQRLDEDGMERHLAAARAADPDETSTDAYAWGQLRGMLALLGGDFASASAHFERGVALLAGLAHPEPLEFRALWPLLLASVGDPRARGAIADARARGVMATFANRGLLGYADAILTGRAGDHATAADLAARADAYLVHFPVWADVARLAAAEPATRDGWGRPAAWLAAAEPVFAATGLPALAQRCRRTLDRGLITVREADVLALVADGLANKQIASALHLSGRTVEKHVENLLRKTGSRSRTQLALWAARQIT